MKSVSINQIDEDKMQDRKVLDDDDDDGGGANEEDDGISPKSWLTKKTG